MAMLAKARRKLPEIERQPFLVEEKDRFEDMQVVLKRADI
jgi:hypothetical protein